MAEAQHKSLELSPARYVLFIVGIVERMNRVVSSDEKTKNNSISGTYWINLYRIVQRQGIYHT